MGAAVADRIALGALEAALAGARETGEDRPALEVIAVSLAEMGIPIARPTRSLQLLERDRDTWLRRLQSGERSASSLAAYRHTIDHLLAWAREHDRVADLFEETTIIDYLDDYRLQCKPAPATYYRRFLLLRRFVRWVSNSNGLPDPFVDLPVPAKPRKEAEWLTREDFARLLDAAGRPRRRHAGMVERDQLLIRTLAMTGLRRSELLALDWSDLALEGQNPSLLVRIGKRGKPRRQPLEARLAADLARWRAERAAQPSDPVFCGLRGKRLQPTILTGIIGRASTRAAIPKHVTAHTLRHTTASWLRQATGDTRLVAEYLGHADLSTVSRYAHVASEELHTAAQALAQSPPGPPPPVSRPAQSGYEPEPAVHPGQLTIA